MVGVGRQAIGSEADPLLVAELLGGDLDVAWIAKVAGVVVLIAATKGERNDVIDDGGDGGAVPIGAALT